MTSWLKRAEDLFEVVDRRAKLVVNELSEEQPNVQSTASNGKISQSRKARSKAKAQKRASTGETLKPSHESREGSSLPSSQSDSKIIDSTDTLLLETNAEAPEAASVQTCYKHDEVENNISLSGSVSTTSSETLLNDEAKHDTEAEIAVAAVPGGEAAILSTSGEVNHETNPALQDETPSKTNDTVSKLFHDDHLAEPGQNIRLEDAENSSTLNQDGPVPPTARVPTPLVNDEKQLGHDDNSNELVLEQQQLSGQSSKISPNKIQEQLDEAQGLLKSTNTAGQSKEARLARVCAGLSTRLQEYKSENAQLEELLTAERELSKSYEDRIKQLQKNLSASKAEMTRVEANMAEALSAKNSEIETLVSSMDSFKKQAAMSEGNLASLQANMETLMRSRELAETRMMQALREELASAERRAEEERLAHNATKKASMEREVELEHRAIDASTALAKAQRLADDRTAKAAELEHKVALLEAECSSLNQELQDMEAKVRLGQKKSPEDANQLIQALQDEVERARQEQRDAETKAELQKVKVEMAAMKRDAEHYSRQEHMELEKRYRELTDLLYYKQTQLETMASEKAAAEFQLEKEMRRMQEAQAEAEKSRVSRKPSTSWEEDADMRELEPLPLFQRHMVGASIQMRRAAKFLDTGAVRATRFLWRYPTARLSLMFYLVFVHLFLMYLLHRLQEQDDNFAAREVAQSMGLSQPNLP
ncbi:Golgin putative 1-like protein [Drosera capensis]